MQIFSKSNSENISYSFVKYQENLCTKTIFLENHSNIKFVENANEPKIFHSKYLSKYSINKIVFWSPHTIDSFCANIVRVKICQ